MPLSNLVDDYYFNLNVIHVSSSELIELANPIPGSAISTELNELANPIPGSGISTEMNSQAPALVVVKGTNLVTGQYTSLNPGDNLVASDGSAYAGITGIRGITGLTGTTGIVGVRGATGLIGVTGIQGITGFSLAGATGIIGITGVVGITGFQPAQGNTGVSLDGYALAGVQAAGITGFVGITGANYTYTGLAGATGIIGRSGIGVSGIIGLTGASSSATGLIGATGVTIGSTGLQGINGATGLTGPTVNSISILSAQTQNAGTSLTYAIPGATLSVNLQRIVFLAWGTGSTSWEDTTLTVTLGGSTLFSKLLSGAGGVDFYIKGVIIRINSTLQQNSIYLIGSYGVIATYLVTTSLDLSLSQSLIVSATSNSITNALIVRKVLA
jgi:hypothetical protein